MVTWSQDKSTISSVLSALPSATLLTGHVTAAPASAVPGLGFTPINGHIIDSCRLTTMFKIVQGLVAVLSSHLISADSRTRANHVYKFKNISASSTVYKNSFFPRTIPQWNSLDKDIAEAPSLSCFKNRLPQSTCVLTMLA